MILINEKHHPFACINTKSFAFIRESFEYIRETFAFIHASYAIIRESYAFLKKRFVCYKNEDFVQLNNLVGFFVTSKKRDKQLQILKKIISYVLK